MYSAPVELCANGHRPRSLEQGKRRLAQRAEEILDFCGKRSRLLHGGEMTAGFHLCPSLDVGVCFFCYRTRRHDYFLWERSIACWDSDWMLGRDRQAGV